MLDLQNLVNKEHPLNQDRIAWWLSLPGLEGGKNFFDIVYANHGVLTNMNSNTSSGWQTTSRPGGWGNIQFDGSDDYVQTPVVLPTTNFSYAFWAKSSDSSIYNRPVGAADYASGLYGSSILWGYSNPTQLYMVNRSGQNNGATDIPNVDVSDLNTGWHMIVAIISAEFGARLYCDAKFVGSQVLATSIVTNNIAFRIGCDGNQNQGGFNGFIDDISIWSRALSSQEVLDAYNLSRTGYSSVINRVVHKTAISMGNTTEHEASCVFSELYDIPVSLFDPVNRHHRLNEGRVAWWLTLPGLEGGRHWLDLVGLNHATLENMETGGGWKSTTRQGGRGEIVLGIEDNYPRTIRAPKSNNLEVSPNGFTIAISYIASYINNYETTLLSYGSIGSYPYMTYLIRGKDNNRLEVLMGYGGNYYTIISNILSNDTWYRVHLTSDGTTVRGYINGIEFGFIVVSGAVFVGGTGLIIGNDGFFTNRPWYGSVDDLSIWHRTLSASEVFEEFNLSRTGHKEVLNNTNTSISKHIVSSIEWPSSILFHL